MNLALMQLLLAVGTQPGRVTAPSLLHIALPILFRMAYLFFVLVSIHWHGINFSITELSPFRMPKQMLPVVLHFR